MARCALCDKDALVGPLCRDHVRHLARTEDITADQIFTGDVALSPSHGPGSLPGRHRTRPGNAAPPRYQPPLGWLIDQWGRNHPMAAVTIVGRARDRVTLAILHHSVSAIHARISDRNGRLWLVDQGSLNGTYVHDTRVHDGYLRAGDRVAFGEVAFFVVTRLPTTRASTAGVGGTVPTRSSDLIFAVRLSTAGCRAELRQRPGGGVLRTGIKVVDLAQLEMAVLQALIERAMDVDEPELRFVATPELLRVVDFRSFVPTSENLRELIRRVRRKLKQVGITDLIESRRGAGYRVTWSIEPLDAATGQ